MSGPDILLVVASIALSAFCSGSETAFSAASRLRAYQRSREGSRGASLALRLLQNPEVFLSTTLVGTNIGVVVASSITATALTDPDRAWTEPVVVLGMAFLILILAEVLPKQTMLIAPDRSVDRLAPLVYFLRFAFFPFVLAAQRLVRLIVGIGSPPRIFESREEIRAFLLSAGGEEGETATRGLELGTATAWFHRRELSAFPSVHTGMPRASLLEECRRAGSGFLLVFESDGRTLRGYVRTVELARQTGMWRLETLVDALPYFDRKQSLASVLYELRRAHAPAGVVLGSTGQPEGIITFSTAVDALLGPSTGVVEASTRKIDWNRSAELDGRRGGGD
ncbi:DUF21 domain-containing protein [Candidatus Fermentibacterales bacterium]|nr:DUF21 domain-containing protein [Candidatus Fermentibacterales bacterium]